MRLVGCGRHFVCAQRCTIVSSRIVVLRMSHIFVHTVLSMSGSGSVMRIKLGEFSYDTLEKFHIFPETKIDKQINEKLTVKPNIVFDIIIRNDPHRGIPSTNSS